MNYDVEILRKIIEHIDKMRILDGVKPIHIQGLDQNIVAYHCRLLHSDGLIDACKVSLDSDENVAFCMVGGVTLKGYSFYKIIKEEGILNKISKKFCEVGTDKTIEKITEVVLQIAPNITPEILKVIYLGVNG